MALILPRNVLLIMSKERVCIYTCLFGGYEKLNEFTPGIDSGYECICFTDDPLLTSSTWTIRVVDPMFSMDSVRSQRRVKMLAHEYLLDFDVSIYVDNSVVLKAPVDTILETYLKDADMAVPSHSFHSCVLDEFIAVAEHGLDEPSRIFEQLNHYQLMQPEVLEERPYWTAILLRRHHEPRVREAMILWYNHVMRYSRRDQLSLNMAVGRAEPQLQRIDISNHDSWFHRWPFATSRKTSKRLKDFSMAGMSAVAQRRLTELELESLSRRLAEQDKMVAELSASLDRFKGEYQRMQTSLELGQQQLEAEREQLGLERLSRRKMEESIAWRVSTRLQKALQKHPRLSRIVSKTVRHFAGRE